MVLEGLHCYDAYSSLLKMVSPLLILNSVGKYLDKSSLREERFVLAYSSSGVESTEARKAWREEKEDGWSPCIRTQKAGQAIMIQAFSKWTASSTVSLPTENPTSPNQLGIENSNIWTFGEHCTFKTPHLPKMQYQRKFDEIFLDCRYLAALIFKSGSVM